MAGTLVVPIRRAIVEGLCQAPVYFTFAPWHSHRYTLWELLPAMAFTHDCSQMQRERVVLKKLVAAAFTGETDPVLEQHVDVLEWMRVGQLNRLLTFFRAHDIHHAIMAGQIAPKNLFDLRPDWKALMLLGKLKQRNAESIFAAIADELAKVNVDLLPATTFLENSLAASGPISGPKLSRNEEEDVDLGWKIAKEIARLDVGQTVLVRSGTVVAVEALEGTNDAIRRGRRTGGERSRYGESGKAQPGHAV